jgi:biofilm protein TabA
MIYDKIASFHRYQDLSHNLGTALSYLSNQDFSTIRPGRIDLQGDDLFALVQEYTTRPFEQGVWEAHRRYIDVQYMISGRERIYFAPLETMQLGTYVPEKDFLPMTGDGIPLDLFAGFFVVFYPEDAHMPGLQATTLASVKKVVVKIKI